MSFENIFRRYQGINTLTQSLIGRPAFDELHVTLPNPSNPESGFIRATSWLYCLYFEAGRTSLIFLRRLGETYTLIDRESIEQHVEAIRCLRTELHHNLGFAESDLTTRSAANIWRRKACGTALPQTTKQWKDCYLQIVDDSGRFLEAIDAVVRKIESDKNGAQQHVDEWLRRLKRNWGAPEFDPLINDAKYHLAREALNTISFRNRHINRWRKYLERLEDDFDFEFEATRLIEKTLLDEGGVILPITGRDLVEHLGVKPSPKIGKLLEEARRYFEVHPCCKDELLAHVRAYNDQS